MRILNYLFQLKIIYFCIGFFYSCSLLKSPVAIKKSPVSDTVKVYHFIVSPNKTKIADTAVTNNCIRESKKAYNWISKEANANGHNLFFKEFWPTNKDSNLKSTFIYKLPSTSLQKLIFTKRIKIKTKKTKTEPAKTEIVNLNKPLFDSISRQLNDKYIADLIRQTNGKSWSPQSNELFVIHVPKAKKSRVLGFFDRRNVIFIGHNKSYVIAHETIHFLGAPDLYLHRYSIGKNRRIVKRKLWSEIMDYGVPNTENCSLYYISNYTAYTIGWTKDLKREYKPLLKQSRIANIIFYLSLLLTK